MPSEIRRTVLRGSELRAIRDQREMLLFVKRYRVLKEAYRVARNTSTDTKLSQRKVSGELRGWKNRPIVIAGK
jgi:hypothetical protein